MVTDVLGDGLTRIKNAVLRGKSEVTLIKSGPMLKILEVLEKEEFIGSFIENDRDITVTLVYEGNEPVVSTLTRVSKPGLRVYTGAKDITPVMNGRGISIISTSEGIMTGAMAKSKGLGGEYICKVW